jgi:hypothetical protein
MPKLSRMVRHSIIAVALFSLLPLVLSACGTPTAVPKPFDVPTPIVQPTGIPAPQPTATLEQPSGGIPKATSPADTAGWSQVSRTASGTIYSYHYPPGWTPDLSYCAPGAGRNASGSVLPAGCASTDILVGQKAKDVGTLTGDNITINGKQAIKQINRAPRNGQAELIYTVLVYDPSGTPLAGFSTSIGPGTETATINNIVATLDQIAGTLAVGR